MSECTPDTPVVDTVWELDAAEQSKLRELFPRARGVIRVGIGRAYKAANRWVGFQGLSPLKFDRADVLAKFQRIKAALAAASAKLEPGPKSQLDTSVAAAETAISKKTNSGDWALTAKPAMAALRQAVSNTGAALALGEPESAFMVDLEGLADAIATDEKAHLDARKWAINRLPVFVYVDEYPELDGHQNIDEYLHRMATNQRTTADLNFEKLCKVADLNPQQLKDLLAANEHETRNQLANRAGAVVTGEIRRLWKDRALKVRFNPDAAHLDTFIADPNALYDVEVNLDERSRGFKWFFSFYVSFAADTKGGSAENAVLLLDEPGLYLHATSQADLLKHLASDFKNQVIFTTHSPFMVPTDNLDSVRTVNIGQDEGTTASNDPTGDPKTLFPIQAALGYHLAQALFVGPDNLIVEGVTDYWIISSISDYLRNMGQSALPPGLTLTPAGGAQKVAYMVALLSSERLGVMVLFDDEGHARLAKDDLVKQKLIRDENVIFVTDAFDPAKPSEADVEDVLDPAVYDALVAECYIDELKGKSLTLNMHIPRIVKRYEEAFKAIGLEFYKTRPARLLLHKMARDTAAVMTSLTAERFERLLAKISAHFHGHKARAAAPFR